MSGNYNMGREICNIKTGSRNRVKDLCNGYVFEFFTGRIIFA
jgi:hypothetical protein